MAFEAAQGERIRPARADDVEAMAETAIAAWREGFRGIVPDQIDPAWAWRPERISERLTDPAYDERAILVAEAAGSIAGLIVCGPSRDRDGGVDESEVMALYVHPARWRQGVGRALVEAALDEFDRAGRAQAIVWTLAESPRNIAFYEAQGFSLDGGTQRRPSFGNPLEVRLRLALADRRPGDDR